MFYSLTMSCNLSIFDTEIIHFKIRLLCSNKSFSNNRFSFINYWMTLYHYLITMTSLIYCKFHYLDLPIFIFVYLVSTHILFGLCPDLYRILWKVLIIVMPFSSFNCTTYTYLLKVPITHNKNGILWLIVLINCISARSMLTTLPIKDECSFHFPNFRTIGLCSSSANCWVDIFSFFSKLQTIK